MHRQDRFAAVPNPAAADAIVVTPVGIVVWVGEFFASCVALEALQAGNPSHDGAIIPDHSVGAGAEPALAVEAAEAGPCRR